MPHSKCLLGMLLVSSGLSLSSSMHVCIKSLYLFWWWLPRFLLLTVQAYVGLSHYHRRCKLLHLPLRIISYSGKLSREKTFANWWKIRFRWENFRRLLAFAVPKDTMPPNFAEKTFTDSHKTRNLRKFSPSKVFRYTVSTCWFQLVYIQQSYWPFSQKSL